MQVRPLSAGFWKRDPTRHRKQSMIDIAEDKLVPIAQLARYVPGHTGRGVNPCTVYRWITVGVDGRKLEAMKIGRILYTSVAALQRFGVQLSPPRPGPAGPAGPGALGQKPPRRSRRRRRQINEAKKQLAAAGI